ncbi:DUF3575 domain-containing protein [Chryseobacterium sp. FH1]|uniref:DUF3575 domain-containing protein n=1 Tax=Chryseobacterium sp. FH1 TaxID=1233951 RepID=UPI0004E4121A|nr:DUF3575 domain-containing protein [Chryseobacterium sp. FH1]KFC20119.1 hypothetical protein IO90_13050 [Chryseobacterium sp. FH1]
MRNLISLSFLCLSIFCFSQKNETYIKANALFLPVGMLNVGVEQGFTDHITGQADVFISPWKSFAGKHAQVYMLGFNARYYFSEAFRKFYVGVDVSGAGFNIQKYGYWNDNYYVHKNGEATPYINSNLYQKGYSLILGAMAGYQFKCTDRLNLDFYIGFGTMQSFYKGYDKLSGDRYDAGSDSMGRELNRSGEWLPYKGGLMLSYKL